MVTQTEHDAMLARLLDENYPDDMRAIAMLMSIVFTSGNDDMARRLRPLSMLLWPEIDFSESALIDAMLLFSSMSTQETGPGLTIRKYFRQHHRQQFELACELTAFYFYTKESLARHERKRNVAFTRTSSTWREAIRNTPFPVVIDRFDYRENVESIYKHDIWVARVNRAYYTTCFDQAAGIAMLNDLFAKCPYGHTSNTFSTQLWFASRVSMLSWLLGDDHVDVVFYLELRQRLRAQ